MLPRGLGLGNEARLPDSSQCACTKSSRSCTACVLWNRRCLPRLIMLRSTSEGCVTCFGMTIMRRRARLQAGSRTGPRSHRGENPALKARRLAARCKELRRYIESNEGALIDYGQRHRAGKPISTSRAEVTVNNLVNARMNKRRQICWSPRGTYCVLQVKTAVLDGRFSHPAIQLATCTPNLSYSRLGTGRETHPSQQRRAAPTGQYHDRSRTYCQIPSEASRIIEAVKHVISTGLERRKWLVEQARDCITLASPVNPRRHPGLQR